MRSCSNFLPAFFSRAQAAQDQAPAPAADAVRHPHRAAICRAAANYCEGIGAWLAVDSASAALACILENFRAFARTRPVDPRDAQGQPLYPHDYTSYNDCITNVLQPAQQPGTPDPVTTPSHVVSRGLWEIEPSLSPAFSEPRLLPTFPPRPTVPYHSPSTPEPMSAVDACINLVAKQWLTDGAVYTEARLPAVMAQRLTWIALASLGTAMASYLVGTGLFHLLHQAADRWDPANALPAPDAAGLAAADGIEAAEPVRQAPPVAAAATGAIAPPRSKMGSWLTPVLFISAFSNLVIGTVAGAHWRLKNKSSENLELPFDVNEGNHLTDLPAQISDYRHAREKNQLNMSYSNASLFFAATILLPIVALKIGELTGEYIRERRALNAPAAPLAEANHDAPIERAVEIEMV